VSVQEFEIKKGTSNQEIQDIDFNFGESDLLLDTDTPTSIVVEITPSGQLTQQGIAQVSGRVVKVLLNAASAVLNTTYNVDVWATGSVSGVKRNLEANVKVVAT
jgi:hypothetical protein